MDKNIIKVIGLILCLIAIVAAVVFVLIKGISIGPINAISIAGISDKKIDVENAKLNLQEIEESYDETQASLETAKKQFNSEKESYELISDDTIKTVKEATKEEEYLIEYLWITLGNYATAHNLSLAVIEPGGSVAQTTTDNTTTKDSTTVSTGTGIKGDNTGVVSNDKTQDNSADSETSATPSVAPLVASDSALTVQVKGSYIDLADFVFEVENDKSLRFRLDNIKMSSAGGTEVVTTFNVKDFTVLKYLE